MNWLPLTDYSTKYQVSISTLRRRIRRGRAEVRFLDGRYYLKDSPLIEHSVAVLAKIKDEQVPPHQVNSHHISQSSLRSSLMNSERVDLDGEAPLVTTTNNILNEIKKAYKLVFKEKEEQVLILKEEISNLNMLVRVLESENDRLKKISKQASWDI